MNHIDSMERDKLNSMIARVIEEVVEDGRDFDESVAEAAIYSDIAEEEIESGAEDELDFMAQRFGISDSDFDRMERDHRFHDRIHIPERGTV